MVYMKISRKITLSLLMLTATLTAWADGWNWITTLNLSDNIYISQMSLPGAHDAATKDVSIGECQTLNLEGLWDAGVRVFDLRPTDANNCPIYHGSLSTGINLTQALTTITGRIATYPNEFAIILMRNENDKGSTDNWKNRVTAIINNFSSYVIPFNNNLRYQDVRGKVVVLSRDYFADGYTIGGWGDAAEIYEAWPNGDGAFRFRVQDYYKVGNSTSKQNVIKALLDEARTQTSPNFMFINHTSGYEPNWLGIGDNNAIKTNASKTNKCALDYINANPGRTGIIMMDHAGTSGYYGADLCNAIIAQNNSLAGLNLATLPDNTDYFLQNVETGLWLQGNTAKTTTDRSGWNTAANMGTYGRPFRIQSYAADGYTLNTQSGPNALGCNYGDANLLYLDGSIGPSKWKFTGTREAAHITINWDRWLSVDANNRLVNSNPASTWKIWTRAERIAEMANATADNPQDVTWLMVNPELMNNDNMTPQWSITRSGGDQSWKDGFRPNRVFETWNYKSMDFYQTINVPNGWYEVQAYALFSPTEGSGLCKADYDDYMANGDATVNGYLYANNEHVKLPSIYSFTSSTPVANYAAKALVDGGVSVVDGWWQAARAMGEDNKFLTKPLYVCVTNGQLRLGIKEVNNTNPFKSHWIIIGSFSLKYFGLGTTIDEDVAYTPVAKSNAFVNVKRTITASTSAKPVWNSLVLPFALTAEQAKAAFGDDVQVAEYSENSADANNATVNFDTKSSPTIAANVPVLIKTSTAGSTFFFSGVNIAASASPKKTGTNFDFVGSYATINQLPDNCYFVNGNSLYKSAGQTHLKGTRAYIAPKSGSSNARIVGFSLDGETISTGISSMHNSECIMHNDVFDLQGRKVSKQAQKGVYIINGKKVVVK